jgi:integrase
MRLRGFAAKTVEAYIYALLGMAYGSGLRVSELVRVKIADIDRGRMMLRVDQGKGHKDRYTVPSARGRHSCAAALLRHPSDGSRRGHLHDQALDQKVRAYGWLAQRHKTATLAARMRRSQTQPPKHV